MRYYTMRHGISARMCLLCAPKYRIVGVLSVRPSVRTIFLYISATVYRIDLKQLHQLINHDAYFHSAPHPCCPPGRRSRSNDFEYLRYIF